MDSLTTDQLVSLLTTRWVVEICGDLGVKAKERLTFPVKECHVINGDVLIKNSLGNLISVKVDKSYKIMRLAFQDIIRWETQKILYANWSNTRGKLFRNRWECILYERYLFYKAQGVALNLPQTPDQNTQVLPPASAQSSPTQVLPVIYSIPPIPKKALPEVPLEFSQATPPAQLAQSQPTQPAPPSASLEQPADFAPQVPSLTIPDQPKE